MKQVAIVVLFLILDSIFLFGGATQEKVQVENKYVITLYYPNGEVFQKIKSSHNASISRKIGAPTEVYIWNGSKYIIPENFIIVEERTMEHK